MSAFSSFSASPRVATKSRPSAALAIASSSLSSSSTSSTSTSSNIVRWRRHRQTTLPRSFQASPRISRRSRSSNGSIAYATFNPGGPSGLTPELKAALDDFVKKHRVVAFIKGTKDFPQCGFSNTVVQILASTNVPFETVDVLADDRLRSGLKEFSSWPTFPQVYVGGEFFGGCDIMIEAYQSGELVEVLETALSE